MNGYDSLEPVPEQEMKTIKGGTDVVDTNPISPPNDGVNISIPDEADLPTHPGDLPDLSDWDVNHMNVRLGRWDIPD